MKARSHDPLRLDMAAAAADGAELGGEWPLAQFERLLDGWPADAPAPEGTVRWQARAEQRKPNAVEPEIWMELQARAEVWRECQRCLQPVAVPLAFGHWLRFVRGEAEAARLDADSEDDVLELPRQLDLRELVEDELLMALPIVPRHEACPASLPMSVGEDEVQPEPEENPFAVLAQLKKRAPNSH